MAEGAVSSAEPAAAAADSPDMKSSSSNSTTNINNISNSNNSSSNGSSSDITNSSNSSSTSSNPRTSTTSSGSGGVGVPLGSVPLRTVPGCENASSASHCVRLIMETHLEKAKRQLASGKAIVSALIGTASIYILYGQPEKATKERRKAKKAASDLVSKLFFIGLETSFAKELELNLFFIASTYSPNGDVSSEIS